MAHNHSVYDTDAHFVIDKDTRKIQLDADYLPTIVQHDHNSERFSFELPQYVDGHDMTLCDLVEVHYINVDSSTRETSSGVYEVDDIAANDGKAVCSWLISSNATKYAGKLSFLIRFACTTDGTVDYAWNTAIYADVTVTNGMDNSEIVNTEEYADIIAQWKADLFDAGGDAVVNVNVARDEAIAAVEAAGKNITEAVTIAKTDLAKLMANAIKNTVSGVVIRADDVSTVEHNTVVWVHGKNLLNPESFSSINTDTEYSYENDALTVTGYYIVQYISKLRVGEIYTISFESTRTGTTGGGVSLEFKSETGEKVGSYYYTSVLSKTLTFTVPQGTHWMVVYLYGTATSGGVDSSTYTNLILEKGDTATDYEAYLDPTTVTVTRYGADETDNAATYTPDADGTVSGMTSLSPNMTILTDTDGAIVECEYTVDTKTYIDNKIAELTQS